MKLKRNYKSIDELLQVDVFEKDKFKRYCELVVGVLILSLAFNFFMFPSKIISGFSGIAIIINGLININTTQTIFTLTAILLIIGWFALGEEKIKMTVAGALLYPVFLEITEPIMSFVTFDSSDMLLSVVFGGFLSGIGSGLVFKAGFSTGGADTLIQILNKYLKISLGTANMLINSTIIILGVFVFGIQAFLYSLIFLYISSLVMDKIILGISSAKAFYIITEHEEEVKTYIMKKLNRGVTIIDAKGGFTNHKEKVLMCIIPTKDYFKLKETIDYIDKKAVLLITDVYQSEGSR